MSRPVATAALATAAAAAAAAVVVVAAARLLVYCVFFFTIGWFSTLGTRFGRFERTCHVTQPGIFPV